MQPDLRPQFRQWLSDCAAVRHGGRWLADLRRRRTARPAAPPPQVTPGPRVHRIAPNPSPPHTPPPCGRGSRGECSSAWSPARCSACSRTWRSRHAAARGAGRLRAPSRSARSSCACCSCWCIPLVLSALALGVAELGDLRQLGRIGLKTLAYTVVVSSIAVLIGVGLVNLVRPGDGLLAGAARRICDDALRRRRRRPGPAAPAASTSSSSWCRANSSRRWPTATCWRSWSSRCCSASAWC